MKAIYRGRKVDVWQVSRDNVQPDWVKDAFEHNGLRWLHGSGNKVRIYCPFNRTFGVRGQVRDIHQCAVPFIRAMLFMQYRR